MGTDEPVTYSLRISRPLLDQVRSDLSRPHPFAFERVGFVLAREATGAGPEKLLLASGYEPVLDEEYVQDDSVGARINSATIRRAMQHILSTGESAFHVHLHAHRGRPAFSHVDQHDLASLIPSFCAVNPHVAHGALLLSYDQGIATAWKHESTDPFSIRTITIVGYPLQRWEEYP